MTLAIELRHAIRRLARRPLFSLSIVAVLALGIGANTAVFSLLHGVVLEALPLPAPERAVYVGEADTDGSLSNLGFTTYVDLRERARSFERLAAASWWSPTLQAGDEPRTVFGRRVSASFLPTLGLAPELGRSFTAEEDRPGAPRVVMLSHGLWRTSFGGDAAVLGRTVLVNEIPHEVVGVLPAALDHLLGPGPGNRLDLLAPLRYDVSQPWACRSCGHLFAIGRLAEGVDLRSARAELDTIFATLQRDHPDDYATGRGAVVGMAAKLTGDGRALLGSLYAGVALVLLLVAANVTALFAARALERRRELAVRRSLGASARHFLIAAWSEPVLLVAVGTLAGVGLAGPLLRLVVDTGALDLPRLDEVGLSGAVLFVTAATSALVALFAGIAPARLHLRTSARAAAVATLPGNEDRRWVSRLVIAELAAALTLLFASGLVTRSLGSLLAEDPGFRAAGVLTASVSAVGPRYEGDAATHAFFERALARVVELPGVESAAWTSLLPLGGNFDRNGLRFRDLPEMRTEDEPSADRYAVTPGYFAVMGIRLVAGRFLSPADDAGAEPVVLLTRGLVERTWPGESGLDKQVQLGGPEAPWRRVVGVVEAVRQEALDRASPAQIYLPATQWMFADSYRSLVVRTRLPAAELAAPLRAAIHAVDPLRPVERIAPMERLIARSLGHQRFAGGVWLSFATLALALAAIGTFGLFARQLALRRRELGVRAALGAGPRRLAAEVRGDTLRLIGAALLLAWPASWAVGRLLASQLWKVSPGDPATLVAASLVVAATAFVATVSPTRRAARTDPASVLREE